MAKAISPQYLAMLARLGGYLARACDPPPGIIVVWRGLSRLTDVQFGVEGRGGGNLKAPSAVWRCSDPEQLFTASASATGRTICERSIGRVATDPQAAFALLD